MHARGGEGCWGRAGNEGIGAVVPRVADAFESRQVQRSFYQEAAAMTPVH